MNLSTCKLKQDLKKRVTFCRKNSFAANTFSFIRQWQIKNFPERCANLLNSQTFSQNLHEKKGIGPRGGAASLAPPRSDNDRGKTDRDNFILFGIMILECHEIGDA